MNKEKCKPELLADILCRANKNKEVSKEKAKVLYSKAGGNFRNITSVIDSGDIYLTLNEETAIRDVVAYSNALLQESFSKQKFRASSQSDIIAYFKSICYDLTKEIAYCIFLDAKNKISSYKVMCEGTITQSLMCPREIIFESIKRTALSIVVVHNHPSGDPAPSENDRKLTRKLLFATKETDIILLDHIIVGTEGKGYFSFYEEGLMERYNTTYRGILEANQL